MRDPKPWCWGGDTSGPPFFPPFQLEIARRAFVDAPLKADAAPRSRQGAVFERIGAKFMDRKRKRHRRSRLERDLRPMHADPAPVGIVRRNGLRDDRAQLGTFPLLPGQDVVDRRECHEPALERLPPLILVAPGRFAQRWIARSPAYSSLGGSVR